MNRQGPPPAVAERWEELLEDAEATAAEYAENGWRTVLVDVGDVTPLSDDPFGLDVLAPGDVVETLEALLEEVTFDTSQVYRAEDGGARFYIIVTEASEDGVAVVVPAYLSIDEADPLAARAEREGVMYTHVRPLSGDRRVTFSHDDPGLFF